MTATSRMSSAFFACFCAVPSLALAGCSMNKMVADTTAGVLHEAAPALDAMWDYELAGAGIPGAIVQLEAFWSITPDNEELTLNLAKAYLGYAQGWVENDYEVAYAAADFDKADRLRQRARLMYLRAHRLALRAMRNRDDAIDGLIKSGDQEKLAEHLKDNYVDADDVGPVFYAGLALGAAINVSMDQPDLIAELPTAKTLVARAQQIDDMFFNGGAYVFLGAAESAFSQALGGNPEKGKDWFEQGLAKTGRKNHLLQVNYARQYAVNTQNKQLFFQLLNEVIEAPDQGPAVRLSNKIARVRAARYLAQAKEWF
jgi:TRAP transporter T-component